MTEVEDIAAHTRMVFETILKSSLGHRETAGTCLYAAALCAMLINKFITGGQTYVVDITGDQFGLDPVIVAELDALPANYVPGCQATVDAHMQITLADLNLS